MTSSRLTDTFCFLQASYLDPRDETEFFVFMESGTWAHYAGDLQLASGRYSVEADTYIQTGNSGGCPVPMSYTYTFDGERLHFQLTDESRADTCGERKSLYDNRIYRLSP